MVSREVYVYINTLEKALEDNIITKDEDALLKIIREKLGISKEQTGDFEKNIRAGKTIRLDAEEEEKLRAMSHPDKDKEIYTGAVLEALADQKITEDEFAILNCLREAYHISLDEHDSIVEEMKAQVKAKGGPNAAFVLDRLNVFIKKIKNSLEMITKKVSGSK